MQIEQVHKTIAIIPGKVTETKIYTNLPMHTVLDKRRLERGSTFFLYIKYLKFFFSVGSWGLPGYQTQIPRERGRQYQ